MALFCCVVFMFMTTSQFVRFGSGVVFGGGGAFSATKMASGANVAHEKQQFHFFLPKSTVFFVSLLTHKFSAKVFIFS